ERGAPRFKIEGGGGTPTNKGTTADPKTGNPRGFGDPGAGAPGLPPFCPPFSPPPAAGGRTPGSPSTGTGGAGRPPAPNGNTGSNEQVKFDSHGNAIAVWYTSDRAGNQSIYANRYTAGSGWGTAQAIESQDKAASSKDDPRIAIDANGNAIVVWTQYDNVV